MLDTRIQYLYQPKHVDAPPHYATHHAAGLDLTADIPKPIMLHALQRQLIPTGVYLTSMPTDCELQIRPRSGLANGAGVTVLNGPGLVDADYTNKDPLDKEIKVLLINLSDTPYTVEPGSKIAQGVFNEVRHAQQGYEQAQERTGGFGSTDVPTYQQYLALSEQAGYTFYATEDTWEGMTKQQQAEIVQSIKQRIIA